jgi:OOP family OmpA-OmpF porin
MTRSLFGKSILASVALLGLSSAALANGGSYNDSYDSYQPVTEYMPGIYIGIMGGYAMNRWDDLEDVGTFVSTPTIGVDADSGTFAWRPFIGYDFNEYFALEAGYTHLHRSDFNVFLNGVSVYAEDVHGYAVDVNAKLKIPLDNGFGIFTKVGVVYLHASDAPSVSANPLGINEDDRSQVNVMFGAGVSYCFTPNFIVDASWTHYRGDSEVSNDFIPDVDFFALGFSYKFCV